MLGGFKIEKGILMPHRPCDGNLYPFGDMEVGDSFSIGKDRTTVVKLRVASSQYGIRHKDTKIKFSVRKMADGVYRCWRIK